MENASQALIMAASVLITIMIISVGVYLVSSASGLSQSYDQRASAEEIQRFNSKLEKYSTSPGYEYIEDRTQKKNYDCSNAELNEKWRFCNYNTFSDVISAVNYAYNLNVKNDYDNISSIEVIISFKGKEGLDGIYGITPNGEREKDSSSREKKNCIYKLDGGTKSVRSSDMTKEKNLNDFIKYFSESKINIKSKERMYKYGFKGDVSINEFSGYIETISFEILDNKVWDKLINTGEWK